MTASNLDYKAIQAKNEEKRANECLENVSEKISWSKIRKRLTFLTLRIAGKLMFTSNR